MRAADLLDQVRALPSRERRRFLTAVRKLEGKQSVKAPGSDKPVTWPDVEARAKRIFGDRVLPNLVLVERDEESD